MKALILFGHGARDNRWREPFDCLASLWRVQHPQVRVELAFLELMQPSLAEAIATLSVDGVHEIVVVPVFFGRGGHLRNDFPVLLSACRDKFPRIRLIVMPAIGENVAVLQAIVDAAYKGVSR